MSETYDSREDTKAHIKEFQNCLAILFLEIAKRHDKHDASKFEEPEKSVFDVVTPRLKGLTYGSEEYKESLSEMGVALEHHYEHNQHHPEHFKGHVLREPGKDDVRFSAGMKGMTFVDLIEMFCDWCAATNRHEDGDIGKSINHNMKRFDFGETLASIMVNTAQTFNIGRGSHRAFRPLPDRDAI